MKLDLPGFRDRRPSSRWRDQTLTPTEPSALKPDEVNMSTTYGRPAAVTSQSSTAARPGDSVGDRLWSAVRSDEPAPRAPSQGLPVPRFADPVTGASTYYTVTAIDVWGRLADRSPLQALRWQAGHPVAISVVQGFVVVISRPDGRNAVTRQGHLRLPASVRHWSHLNAGDRLLVAACPDQELLAAYPMTAVDAMVLAYHSPLTSAKPQ
jgi:hypothetical protein